MVEWGRRELKKKKKGVFLWIIAFAYGGDWRRIFVHSLQGDINQGDLLRETDYRK